MTRIALANLECPGSPADSARRAIDAIAEAGRHDGDIVCFPECYVPGYRGLGRQVPPPDSAFLERTWAEVAAAARRANVSVILGTERIVDGGVRISALVVGFRYPETVRWAAQRGAQVIFHPHFDVAQPGSYRPSTFADPANTFHEKAALCRAAESTCFFATVNCASDGCPTTSAIVGPDGAVLAWQPYGKAGLLLADVDVSQATGLLAARCRAPYEGGVA